MVENKLQHGTLNTYTNPFFDYYHVHKPAMGYMDCKKAFIDFLHWQQVAVEVAGQGKGDV